MLIIISFDILAHSQIIIRDIIIHILYVKQRNSVGETPFRNKGVSWKEEFLTCVYLNVFSQNKIKQYVYIYMCRLLLKNNARYTSI